MPKKERKPYRPPSVRTERVYERRSLACGKTAAPKKNKTCISNFKLS